MRKDRKAVLAAATLALFAQSVHAVTLSWDADGAPPVDGGTGTWDTTSLLWNNGAGYQNWVQASDAAIGLFAGPGGPGGTLTLAEPITAGALNFNADNYTIDL